MYHKSLNYVIVICLNSLKNIVKKNVYFRSENTKYSTLKTCGIKYLHLFDIMNLDLKPESILMILNNNLIKLADFGLQKNCLTIKMVL